MDAGDEIPPALLEAFREEAAELLDDMEGALILLEERPGDSELVARAFRALHTIKGNAVMFGFEELESLAHELEHLFDLMRKGRMAVSAEVISLTLAAKDRLLALLAPALCGTGEAEAREEIRRRIRTVHVAPPAEPPPPEPEEERAADREAALAFRREAAELLGDLEVALMELERSPGDRELIWRAFRALHTLRGEGAAHGLVEIEAFAGELEDVFQRLRVTGAPVTRELIDLTLEAAERIGRILAGRGDSPTERALRRRELDALQRIEPAAEEAPGPGAAPRWRVRFRPGPETFRSGTDPVAILEGVRALGPCLVRADFGEVPPLEEIEPGTCYLSWAIEVETRRSLEDLRDAFIFVGGPGSAVEIEAAGDREEPGDAEAPRTAGGDAAGAAVPAGEGAAPAAAPRPEGEARGGKPRPEGDAARGTADSAGSGGTLRVGAARLDALVNLVGELVTTQARLTRHAALSGDGALEGIAEDVERLTADLRDLTLGIRMVPVRPAFGKFRRLVRDLAREIGREVEFTTEGEETELDKTVIDRLGDPIVHILRNCIDHGIEPPEERVRAGKPRRGRVRLAATHAGPDVLIRVEDDGRGVDLAAVRRKAVERGLLGEHEEREERELLALVFSPGFSTSARVTNVSGRGVGLDVVKRAVEALRGGIRLESRRGGGTRFEVRLPLTLAIIEGLAVALGGERFIVPLAAVRECVELPAGRVASARTCEVVDVRGEALSFVRLRSWFGVGGPPPERGQIVVTEAAGRRVGLLVDYVIGEHQTVIKPLGRLFRDVRGLAGSTILGDGTVALILDVEHLVQAVEAAD